MGFFKKKSGLTIPPVAPTEGQQQRAVAHDPYAARAAPARRDPYASAGGDPYATGGDPYGAAPGPRAAAGAGADDEDASRNALFAGYNPGATQVQAQRKWGYEGRETEEDFNEDEEIEGIKQEIRQTKQDSLASTRNTLRLAREAEENARGTIGRLADQSERLANSERYLDIAKANSQRAEDQAAHLKQLNRSIFVPVVTWNKDQKRAQQEQKILDRHNMERDDRAKALLDVQDTRRRLNAAANEGYSSRTPVAGAQKARRDARQRYQFDATASDDELENELDENLDETHEIAKRLKNLATAMGTEVEKQNGRIGQITDKTDNLEYKVKLNTTRLAAIK
ncbi:Protein transport protein sec9 [Vanrija pseudolonga]|uniref:Protein transport protein sec9 n=1 Tax=Vanrija pseudolonga TaxID=143232 RepID=A0AAF1BMB6_9TREE|nr:Protein transport protein sec9 [Vanrija pseudolonga]